VSQHARSLALVEVIERLAGLIEGFTQVGQAPINEANTKNWLIEPLLRSMGWDTHDPSAVAAEYRAHGQGQNPVDYALFTDGAPALFLEAKALGTPLSKPKVINQVISYGAIAGVQWVVITDGNEYRIYRTDTNTAAPEKLLAAFTLTDASQRAEALRYLGMLHRDALALDELTGLWAERDIDERLRGTLEGLLTGDDAAFNAYLARRNLTLSRSDVARSLKRATISIAYPKVSVSLLDEASPEASVVPRELAPAERTTTTRFGRLVAALDADGATWPVALHATYRGQRLTASLERDGGIIVLGQRHASFSGAALAVMRAVRGATTRLAANGWRFWRFTRRDGEDVGVGELAIGD
jgi:hypothetical protein